MLYLIFLLSLVNALPILPRLYQPSSGQFSLIAHHQGAQFQYHLVKYDDDDLKLNADEEAFFGRIKANNGYVLNIPGATNGTDEQPSPVNVLVDESNKLTIAPTPVEGLTGFGIEDSLLTYQNVSTFVACPDENFRGEYSIYWNTDCPNQAQGYSIELLVQSDATVNYNPDTNQ
ncbi:hypothetical protein HYPBUDRAFT_112610 [Hyphopichia burtonii NRRL Y-1933]|uniref:Ubiquitin 3 binding protein But2 C-terminal domain-containing protein n=1 Tax=Hyphopichia burtonii NRRL Y-1933 TaxID=984485 RepID=A0A1E4RFH8_9ASCO|nr:hypothetical protein HYPBUDRAFT_112610 [Hyphopichia burtonii NRRL Y-1933]ODV65981.1 hypothetical protein HYPBUDRAFT_112610 [Hyphopichia burtonii NRRL Y-1933]